MLLVKPWSQVQVMTGPPLRKPEGASGNRQEIRQMADTNRNLEQELQRTQIELRNLREERDSLRRFIDSMQRFVGIVESVDEPVEILTLLEQILTEALITINAKDGSLLILDEDTRELVFVLAKGDVPQEQLHDLRIPPDTGVAGWVAANRKSTIVNDPRHDERFYNKVDDLMDFKTNSLLAAPIIGGNRLLGVIEVLNKQDGKQFDDNDESLVHLLCRFAGELLINLEQKNMSEETAA